MQSLRLQYTNCRCCRYRKKELDVEFDVEFENVIELMEFHDKILMDEVFFFKLVSKGKWKKVVEMLL